MIIDVHCHVGYSARPVEPGGARFSFEADGAGAQRGFDSYFSPRVLAKWGVICRWGPARRALGIDWRLGPGPAMDAQIKAFNERHMLGTSTVDRIVLLAFDEYHTDEGRPLGPVPREPLGRYLRHINGGYELHERGSDLYASNSLVRSICAVHPERFLFGASIHPYRTHEGRSAVELLSELKAAGAVLVKWLPLHMNIRASDPRTVAFLRRAAELRLTMLIHYGGEVTLALQHPEQQQPQEMLAVLRQLRAEGAMPTVIIAHTATPSTRLHTSRFCREFVESLTGEFRDAPLFGDISGMSGPGRARWLIRLAKRRETHAKLVWATDFPIPPIATIFAPWIGVRQVRSIRRMESWFDRDVALKRALGFEEGVFQRAGEILGQA